MMDQSWFLRASLSALGTLASSASTTLVTIYTDDPE